MAPLRGYQSAERKVASKEQHWSASVGMTTVVPLARMMAFWSDLMKALEMAPWRVCQLAIVSAC